MKFNLSNVATAIVPQSASDDQFIAALQDLMLAKDHLHACEAQYQEALEVETNCKTAIASLESFGLTDQFLAVFNRDGDMFRQLGMDDVAGSCESMEPEQKEEKKDSMLSKFGKAAAGAGKAVAGAAGAMWEAIIEFLKRWLTVNGRMAARIESGLNGLKSAASIDEVKFKEIKRSGIKTAQVETILGSFKDFDELMSTIKDVLPKVVGGLRGEQVTSLDDELNPIVEASEFNSDALRKIGLTVADGKVVRSTPFEKVEETYGGAGWTVAFLLKNGLTVVNFLKNDAKLTAAVQKAIEAAYNTAKSNKIMDKPTVKGAIRDVKAIVAHRSSLVSLLGASFDSAIKAAQSTKKGASAPAENPPAATK